ncbi:MAG: hypothetical protein AAB871_03395 [Patescibacteria group bacterium]
MRNKLNIHQIFLPNYKHALNFVSLYEGIIRSEDFIHLFLLIEIKGDRKFPAPKKLEEFEKLTRTIAKTLKASYSGETSISEATFEKALTNVNNQLSTLVRKGMVGWYKKLNALIGVYSKNVLYISVTGSASAFLLRKSEFSNISDEVSSGFSPHPLKTFSNFTSGQLNDGDVAVLSTSGLYNYLSLDKMSKALEHGALEDAGRNLTAILKQNALPDEAFGTLLLKISGRLELADAELQPLMSPSSHSIIEDRETLSENSRQRIGRTTKNFGAVIWQIISWFFTSLYQIAGKLFRKTPRRLRAETAESSLQPTGLPARKIKKKTLLWTFLTLAVLLAINVAFFNIRNKEQKSRGEAATLLEEAFTRATDAEAALIYGDQNKATKALSDAVEKIEEAQKVTDIKNIPELNEKHNLTSEKISKLTNQINKVTAIGEVESIGKFEATPDRLIKTEIGFLGFNSFTDSFEFYENARVEKINLTSPMTENILSGAYVASEDSMLFVSIMGNFFKLNAATQELAPMFSTDTRELEERNLSGLKFYAGRFYSVDKTNSQILRIASANGNSSIIESWLKTPFDFSLAEDLAVDGNIFVLLPDSVVKFSKGQKQDFNLAVLSQPLENAKRIFTSANYQYIYITEPENSRILIFSKQGDLATQLVSDKFSDLKDIWVDEPNKMMYVLNGNDLFRFRF